MDADHFDALARALPAGSRRLLLGLGLGSMANTLLAEAEAKKKGTCKKKKGKKKRKCKNKGKGCIKDGQACEANRPETCCSGICENRRCIAAPGALGCTNRQNSCETELPILCPGNQAGACFVTSDQKPFCSNEGICFDCSDDQDCVDEFGVPGAHCITCPAAGCPDHTTLCYFPLSPG